MSTQMMKAFAIPGPGQRTLAPVRMAVPSLGDDELLVHVRAIGVGIHDSYFLPPEMSFPYPIGIEGAGTVAEVGRSASGHQVGDRVAFVSTMQPKGGTWAQYAAVRDDALILRVPDQMSFEQAAAIPVAGSTTLRALHSLPPLGADSAVFIAGASGAIGTLAVQLAHRRGWDVAASASPRNHAYLTGLGASLTVDYHDPDWPAQVRRWRPQGVDGALAVQPRTTDDSASVVRDGGTVVTISGDPDTSTDRVAVAGLSYGVDVRDELHELMRDVVTGDLRLVIERTVAFDDAPSALAKTQTRRARGKVVITVD